MIGAIIRHWIEKVTFQNLPTFELYRFQSIFFLEFLNKRVLFIQNNTFEVFFLGLRFE